MTYCVLVVDDSELDRIMFSSVLRDAGYNVLTAGNGMQAINLALEQKPDAVLMDTI